MLINCLVMALTVAELNCKIDAASAGSCVVTVPAGTHEMSGPLILKSNVHLKLEDGARLVFSDNPANYSMVSGSYEGQTVLAPRSLVCADNVTNVIISGTGVFVAKSDYWQGECYEKRLPRPKFFCFSNCKDICLDGFFIRGGPNWTIHLLESKCVVIRGLDMFCRGRNTDGIDVDSSEDILIEGCRLNQGDDGFVMKSGKNAEGRRRGKPTRNVTIRNCTVVNAHTLLGIGSELSGGIENIRLENCKVEGEVWRVLLVKTNPARGGYARNITVRGVSAARAKCAIFGIMPDYQWESRDKKLNPEIVRTPIEDVCVEDVVCDEAWHAYELNGDALTKPRRIKMRNCSVKTPSRGTGIAENIDDLVLDGVMAEPPPFAVWCDDPDSTYECGQTATFFIRWVRRKGVAHVRLDNFGDGVCWERDVDLASRDSLTVTGRRDVPGLLRLTIEANGEKKVWSAICSAASITSGSEMPEDFERFWRNAIKEYDDHVPEDVCLSLLPDLSTNGFNVSLLTVSDPMRRKVYGFLSEPKFGKGERYPVRVTIPGAGPSDGTPLLRTNVIGLKMNVHYWKPIPGFAKRCKEHLAIQQEEDDALQKEFPMLIPRYTNAGISKGRETYYYYGAILAMNRAVAWLAKRNNVDASRMTYEGGSQGGGLGLALVALNQGFSKAMIGFPALTAHLCNRIDGRKPGWPNLVNAQLVENRDSAIRFAPYFDGVNFARMVHCPIRFLIGSVDEVAPPHAGIAAYNACPSKDKGLLISLGHGHNPPSADRNAVSSWLDDPIF